MRTPAIHKSEASIRRLPTQVLQTRMPLISLSSYNISSCHGIIVIILNPHAGYANATAGLRVISCTAKAGLTALRWKSIHHNYNCAAAGLGLPARLPELDGMHSKVPWPPWLPAAGYTIQSGSRSGRVLYQEDGEWRGGGVTRERRQRLYAKRKINSSQTPPANCDFTPIAGVRQ